MHNVFENTEFYCIPFPPLEHLLIYITCSKQYNKNPCLNWADIDECDDANPQHNCDENAECENNAGSFTCTCGTGYSGDGQTCIGKY